MSRMETRAANCYLCAMQPPISMEIVNLLAICSGKLLRKSVDNLTCNQVTPLIWRRQYQVGMC